MKSRREKLLELKGALSSFNDLEPNATEEYLKKQILAAKLTAKIIENGIDALIANEAPSAEDVERFLDQEPGLRRRAEGTLGEDA